MIEPHGLIELTSVIRETAALGWIARDHHYDPDVIFEMATIWDVESRVFTPPEPLPEVRAVSVTTSMGAYLVPELMMVDYIPPQKIYPRKELDRLRRERHDG